MNLYKSGEDYLEAIFILSKQKETIRSVDLAEYFGYSRASVSHGVSLLQRGGFLWILGDKSLKLTPLGKKVAKGVYERHCLLQELLMLLGVPQDVADKDACEMEHVISHETFLKMKQFRKQVKTSNSSKEELARLWCLWEKEHTQKEKKQAPPHPAKAGQEQGGASE